MVLVTPYINSFKGLSREIWILSLVTLINRAGTMVVPFLSLYLTDERNFTLDQVGWIMTAFGLGSVGGSWLGGKLTDKIGFYNVMFWSLVGSGVLFVLLQYMTSFYGNCAMIFCILLVADCYRPAAYVAMAAYSKPENMTRSISLIRLAINLGFSFGPALGGLLIATTSYAGLFWVEGVTCVCAAFFFKAKLKHKAPIEKDEENQNLPDKSPYKDIPFLIFLLTMLLVAFAFIQLFSTVPLYYRDAHHLTEGQIGWLLAFNGFAIFALEMPIIKSLESGKVSIYRILVGSTILFAAGFAVLNISSWVGVLWISMGLLTIGEILNFPFLNAFALARAGKRPGAYMALFTMTFSVAHIISHKAGMYLVDKLDFEKTWYIMAGVLICAGVLFSILRTLTGRMEKTANK